MPNQKLKMTPKTVAISDKYFHRALSIVDEAEHALGTIGVRHGESSELRRSIAMLQQLRGYLHAPFILLNKDYFK